MQNIWHKLHDLQLEIERIRGKIGEVYAENIMQMYRDDEFDLEGVCLILQGAERYLNLIAETIVARED